MEFDLKGMKEADVVCLNVAAAMHENVANQLTFRSI